MLDVTDSTAQTGTPVIPRLLAWRPLETWQPVLAAGLAVLLAAVLSLAFTGKDLASAQTFVTNATQADIKLADGTQRPAAVGDLVPHGASVLTGKSGGARLTTEGRDVYLGAQSTLRVVDGLHQQLSRGLAMLDTRSGPRVTLQTALGAGTVNAGEGALTRVEQNVGTLRLAVYEGASSITAAGRQATTTVPALRQVRVPYGGVPEPLTALALSVKDATYDAWEQRLAANLVQADIDLNGFAAGLNGVDGVFVLNAAPASLRETPFGGVSRGEQALAVAVAQKGRLHSNPQDNLREVVRDRADGGSWGVVAAIVRAAVSDVTSVLGSSLDDPSTPGDVLAGGPVATGTPQSRPTGDSVSKPPRPSGGPTMNTTSPPVTKDPVDEAVRGIVESVPRTPPSPAPTPTPTPTPSTPVPGPAPGPLSAIISGLLKPVTG